MDYTLSDFFNLWNKEIHGRPGLRLGQSAFNTLYSIRPDLSERVRASHLDPFHDDNRLPKFFGWVAQYWERDDDPS